jgi:hypothetical protein
MARRFLRSFESSFKSNVKNELTLVNQEKERDVFTHHMSPDEGSVAEIFSVSLGVNSQLFISEIIEAELHRMIRIKKRRADFEELNDFYKDVIVGHESAANELKCLVANYLPIPISQLQNERLINYARSRLGLRFNNYYAFKLASFDGGKSSIEVLFYLDNASSIHFKNAWLGIQGQPLKQLTFSHLLKRLLAVKMDKYFA